MTESDQWETFEGTITVLKKRAAAGGVTLTNGQIAEKLNITMAQFNAYYESDRAPGELFALLRQQYREYMGNTIIEKVQFSETVYVEDPEPPFEP